MKIIFLDIDGVLIPLFRKERGLKTIMGALADIPKEVSDNLVKVLRDPSVWIVISSTWRHHWEGCKELLEQIPLIRNEDGQYGINYGYTVWDRVISKTGTKTDGGRSTEILMWLDEHHRTCYALDYITHWVAIDDEHFDMKAIRRIGKLIKTESGVGLTSEHADEIISLLNH